MTVLSSAPGFTLDEAKGNSVKFKRTCCLDLLTLTFHYVHGDPKVSGQHLIWIWVEPKHNFSVKKKRILQKFDFKIMFDLQFDLDLLVIGQNP